MPSIIETNKTKDAESMVTEYNSPDKRSSLQHQSPRLSKERELSPRQSRNMKLLEKDKALKTTKFNRLTSSDKGGLISPMPLRPWPGRKSTGIEEPVKHMSNVPGYLQHMERGYDVQEKALNFGVLDWGLLEKWTYQQKHIVHGGSGNSSSSSNESSSFSTFVSSSQSRRSTASPLSQTELSVPMDGHWNPSVLSSRNKLMEEERSGRVLCFSGSEASPIKFPSGHDRQLDSDYGTSTDCLRLKNGKDGVCSDGEAIFQNVSLPPDVGNSCSTYKNYDTSDFTHKAAEAQDCRSSKEGRCQGYHSSLLSAKDWLEKQCLDESPKKEGMRGHLQQSVRAKDKSFEFSVSNDGRSIEKTQNSPSNSSPEIVQSVFQSPHVPHSCPLPCSILADEPYSASIILQENEVATTKSSGPIVKHNHVTGYSCDQSAFRADRLGQGEAKEASVTGRKLPDHLSSAGSIRSSLRVKQSKSITYPDKTDGDKATTNNRGRHSPLRRLLDPLLKPKHHRNISAPIAALPIHHSYELSDADKPCIQEELALSCVPFASLDTGINSNWQANGNPNSSSPLRTDISGSLQGKGQAASMRHALLQLAWKNGLPLFMFSSNDSNILAATIRKKSISDKDCCECIYTIFSVPKVKKKSGVWINPGSKSRKRGLLSDVVGQIKVSCSKLTNYDSKSHSVIREFVLLGAEPLPTSHEPVGSPFSTELAAVIAEVPQERPGSHDVNVLRCSKCRYLSPMNSAESLCSCCGQNGLQIEQRNDDSSLPTLTAVLPSGVHGLSGTGVPSPLIQRWKSGGTCDCGGWDEGCLLMILTDKFQEKRSPASAKAYCKTDGTHRFELFVQGESLENRHAFSMISFKEGLYTVDFRAPIALLQAFAICIANLHSRKP
ncbi:uncharacterized protein LOC103722538 [Phoenix dactylifera]|uniref:Uncharacterized protein LOC103722538 n=1 Tax=Phoenix dactylifera TaxID=42345 RepID=A0A8B7MWZ8_PHODC|nr:uncharacterized protein LOC103722538 [Phoenix dactylifera]